MEQKKRYPDLISYLFLAAQVGRSLAMIFFKCYFSPLMFVLSDCHCLYYSF